MPFVFSLSMQILTSVSHLRTTAIWTLSALTPRAHLIAAVGLATKEMALTASVSCNFFLFHNVFFIYFLALVKIKSQKHTNFANMDCHHRSDKK